MGTLGDAVTFLYVIPVVLAAIALGTRAGLIAAGVAFCLSTIWAWIDDVPVTALGYFNRAIVFLFVGGLAGHFAARMRALEALAKAPLRVDGCEIELGISVGIALFDEQGCPPAEELLAAADQAMYVVKAAGGGRATLAAVRA